MKTIRWATVLKKVLRLMKQNPSSESAQLVRRNAREAKQTDADYLAHLDVREMGKLRDLFPEAFPPGLKTGVLMADFDARGWFISRYKEMK